MYKDSIQSGNTARQTVTPKEFGEMIGRSADWVRAQCKRGKIPTFPPQQRPYLIPKNVLDFAANLTPSR